MDPSSFANPGVKLPRKQMLRRFAEGMNMSQIHIHPGLKNTQIEQSWPVAGKNNQSNLVHRIHQNRLSYLLLALVVLGGCISLAGCGGIVAKGASSASTGSFTASPATVAFGSVTVGSPATSKVSLVNSTSNSVVVSKITVSNISFSVDGEGALPLTLAANSTTTLNVHFGPATAGSAAGQLVITSDSLVSPSATVQMTGTGVMQTQPPAGTAGLTVNSSSVSFGNVAVGTPSTQSLTMTSSGTGAVTVSGVSISGQTATLSLQFEPTATGAATGKLTITSNASSNSTAVVALSGTGVPLAVGLNWSAPPSSSDAVAGYNIYRAPGNSSSFTKLNSSVNSPDSYMDSTVAAGATYEYYVTTVDSSGAESTPSNTATVAVP
jgi:hypothetical protein